MEKYTIFAKCCLFLSLYTYAYSQEPITIGKSRKNNPLTRNIEHITSDVQLTNDYKRTDFENKIISKFFYSKPIPKNKIKNIKLYSWHNGCPVNIDQLCYLSILHYGFDQKIHHGELIVHKDIADETLNIFLELLKERYPVEKIRLISEYKGNDLLSMKDNNSSAFNCRMQTGSNKDFSVHSYGLAIDINPLMNPYVKNNYIMPPEGIEYSNRKNNTKGMIKVGDHCYETFTRRGWEWGGNWKNIKDYQHFEKRINIF